MTDKEKVNLTIDHLSTQGNKLYLTIAAEALAKTGHDIWTCRPGSPASTPMRWSRSTTSWPRYWPATGRSARRLSISPSRTANGWWCPAFLLLTANSRIDLLKQHAGIDILSMYPAVH